VGPNATAARKRKKTAQSPGDKGVPDSQKIYLKKTIGILGGSKPSNVKEKEGEHTLVQRKARKGRGKQPTRTWFKKNPNHNLLKGAIGIERPLWFWGGI